MYRGIPYCIIILSALLSLYIKIEAKPVVVVHAPTIVFKVAPKRVLIEKEIYVVPDFDHEVFVIHGIYWTYWKGHWYRLPKFNGRWVKVKIGKVPPGLKNFPRGKYIRYKTGVVKTKGEKIKPKHRKVKKHPRKKHKRK